MTNNSIGRLHLPERIVLLIDDGEEQRNAPWDASKSRLEALKEALSGYVQAKLGYSSKHCIAVATYRSDSDVSLLCPFSGNVDTLVDSLTHFKSNGKRVDTTCADTSDGFDVPKLVSRAIDVTGITRESTDDYSTRIVLIYGRSYVIPHSSQPIWRDQIPFIRLDIVYVHVKINSEGNRCQEAFDALANFVDTEEGQSYIFETHASKLKLNAVVTALLAHPEQRSNQEEFMSKLDFVIEADMELMEMIDGS
jgi:hypothetical protein